MSAIYRERTVLFRDGLSANYSLVPPGCRSQFGWKCELTQYSFPIVVQLFFHFTRQNIAYRSEQCVDACDSTEVSAHMALSHGKGCHKRATTLITWAQRQFSISSQLAKVRNTFLNQICYVSSSGISSLLNSFHLAPRIKYLLLMNTTPKMWVPVGISFHPLVLKLGIRSGNSPVTSLSTMMTSSNGNIFRVAGPLCGEFTGNRWIPHTKASDAEVWCFLWSVPE